MRINKKIIAGITVISMLTCGIWMESVLAADTNSPEMFSAEDAVADITADPSEESQTGTITGENPATSTTEIPGASPENRSEISETPGSSDISNASETTTDTPEISDTSETPDATETTDVSNTPGAPEEPDLPENEEPEISQETLPDAQETQPETTFEVSDTASETPETETEPAEEKSGFCGAEEDTVSWNLDENGVLEIAGQGDMKDWENEEEVPWNGYRDQITEVRIEEGVTSIGAYAFAACENLAELDIADSVQTIGAFAYFNCSGLSALTIG